MRYFHQKGGRAGEKYWRDDGEVKSGWLCCAGREIQGSGQKGVTWR
jgi:hypothetical protein